MQKTPTENRRFSQFREASVNPAISCGKNQCYEIFSSEVGQLLETTKENAKGTGETVNRMAKEQIKGRSNKGFKKAKTEKMDPAR